MITQKLKHWLSHLFAWWPWQHASPNRYAQPSDISNVSSIQDTIWYAAIDGPESYPGTISIAIDENVNGYILETDAIIDEDTTDPSIAIPPIIWHEETLPHLRSEQTKQNSNTKKSETVLSGTTQKLDGTQDNAAFSQSEQRRLAFLRYMIQQGTLNEYDQHEIPHQEND
jgi:hypothetical protein